MVEPISGLISSFLAKYPKVRLQLVATDRPVDLIAERIDLALRVRAALTSDAALTMRTLGLSTRILVAAPRLASQVADVAQLAALPTLATSDDADDLEWQLESEDGGTRAVRIMCDVYVTPYLNEAQMTSGTLSYSFGLGKAVVSTPYWHARELLADGRGILVPFGDIVAIGNEIAGLLTDAPRRQAMRVMPF